MNDIQKARTLKMIMDWLPNKSDKEIDFVEYFEESFKVQSKVDYRDLDVNWYGDQFGKLLQENEKLLPSQIMLIRSLKYFRFSP